MTRREHLQEQYEEALFALLMDEYIEEEGEKALRENAALREDPQAEVPAPVVQRCLKRIDRHFAAQRARSIGRVSIRVVNRVAVVALVAMLLFTVAFAASPTFRINTLNLVIETFEESTSFIITETHSRGPLTIGAGWLPDGYQLMEQKGSRAQKTNIYQTNTGNTIEVYVTNINNGEIAIDTENAELNTIEIQGYEATTIHKKEIDGYPEKGAAVMAAEYLKQTTTGPGVSHVTTCGGCGSSAGAVPTIQSCGRWLRSWV